MNHWRIWLSSIFFYIGIWQWAVHHQILAAMIFSLIFFFILEAIFDKLEEIKKAVTNGNP